MLGETIAAELQMPGSVDQAAAAQLKDETRQTKTIALLVSQRDQTPRKPAQVIVVH
jgi:hypothetical protein